MIVELVFLALAATASPAAVLIDVATARRVIEAPPVTAAAERLRQHASSGSTDAVVSELRAVLKDSTLAPPAQEWLLESGLHALRRLPATPAALALADELSTRVPRVLTRVEPEHGDHGVPLYDVASVARYLVRDWSSREAKLSATKSLASSNANAVETWLNQDRSLRSMAVRDGIAAAWREASVEQLAGQRAAVVAAMRAGRDADGLALQLARRLRDAELYSLTVGYAEPAVALAAVQSAARDLDPGTALGVLHRAADREPIASAALLAIGRLAATDSAARQLLFDRLSDPVGGDSAATALARIDDPALVTRLATHLDRPTDELTRRRVVLALRLNGSEAARDALGRLLASKQGSAELRREVAAWLARGS